MPSVLRAVDGFPPTEFPPTKVILYVRYDQRIQVVTTSYQVSSVTDIATGAFDVAPEFPVDLDSNSMSVTGGLQNGTTTSRALNMIFDLSTGGLMRFYHKNSNNTLQNQDCNGIIMRGI